MLALKKKQSTASSFFSGKPHCGTSSAFGNQCRKSEAFGCNEIIQHSDASKAMRRPQRRTHSGVTTFKGMCLRRRQCAANSGARTAKRRHSFRYLVATRQHAAHRGARVAGRTHRRETPCYAASTKTKSALVPDTSCACGTSLYDVQWSQTAW